jgi:alginate O-acetyltransferase complex protein AlgI
MLFNSWQFLFVFFPTVLAGFFIIGHFGRLQLARLWLFGASLFFYAYADLEPLPVILSSVLFNYFIGRRLALQPSAVMLAIGVAGNLLLLGYFKYATLILQTIDWIAAVPFVDPQIRLPIGISFYTFTQIAFLFDAYRRQAKEYKALNYGLFVTFFPHLVAGPILHHKEMIPQFEKSEIYRPQLDFIGLGLSWFAVGLFKKVVLADSVAVLVEPAFGAAAKGHNLNFMGAWIGALSYSLQIYFDFSAYSDMAVGLALMFGIWFPINFYSPYKATSLIEFWRRWHITLSRFLRDYLYIPLGGNRAGSARRYCNLLITMVLGGLWHGASWNFAVWGLIHGIALALCHIWQGIARRTSARIPGPLAWFVTMLVVVLAWVPFRADNLSTSVSIWSSMIQIWTIKIPDPQIRPAALWILVLTAIALMAPNTADFFRHPQAIQARPTPWRPTAGWALALGSVFGVAAASMFGKVTTFLYFKF